MKVKPLGLARIVRYLEDQQPFGFARYGDGEWRTILGGNWIKRKVGSKKKYKKGYRILRANTCYIGQKNSNGCTFTQLLSNDLRKVLVANQDYYHGILRIALRSHRQEIDIFLEATNSDVVWYGGDVLLNKALSGDLFPFIKALREYRILMVGQPFLRGVDEVGFFKPTFYYHAPPKNAHATKQRIEKNVLDLIDKYDINLVLWSSGLATKVFLDDVWKETNGEITQIDCGSMWDGFCGVTTSRSYIRKGTVRWNDLIQVNSGQREKRAGETFRKGK